MTLTFAPSRPRGTVTAPPSKSHAHRLLLCAALADGESAVENVGFSADVAATLSCLQAVGAIHESPLCRTSSGAGGAIREAPLRVVLRGFDPFAAGGALLNCGESASTLRFLAPLCLLSGREFTLTGTPRLLARPLSVYEELCRARGLRFERSETALTVCGRLEPGKFAIPGGVSSQFASGLLFALPLLDGNSTLTLLEPVVSRPYLDLTLQTLAESGIEIREKTRNSYGIPGNQHYLARNATVEGDWSNAAPFFVFRALGCDVRVDGLRPDSRQGDRVCPALLARLQDGFAEIDLTDCPDLGPALFVAAASLHGGRFTGVRRLRDKESDRVAAMQKELAKYGVHTEATDDTLTVHPSPLTAPACPLESHNDHRVAMALAILLTQTGGTLQGSNCVQKSDPQFWTRLSALGVRIAPAP